MPTLLTNGEVRAVLEVGAALAGDVELADPWGWADLRGRPDETVAAVRRRLETGCSPRRGQVFRWPKETGEYRPMAWLDPLDQIVYRGAVGRLVAPVAASVDGTAVLSARVASPPPRWTLERYGRAIAERRARGSEMLRRHPIMGLIDVEKFFPSVCRTALEDTLGVLPVHAPTFAFVLDWLDELAGVSGIKGLPTGHEPSQVLANALLVPCDSLLTRLGVPFMRYVDDTWFFADHPDEFHAIVEAYGATLGGLGLALHPAKTRWLDPLSARNKIGSYAIEYFDDLLDEAGPAALDAGLALFEYALQSPVERKTELRRALRALTGPRQPRPFEALRDDPELLRLAPRHWVRYLGSMMSSKPSRRLVGDDWLVERATQNCTKDGSYANLLYLQVAARLNLDKGYGRQVFALATADGGWRAPVRVWAAHVWGRSNAFNPNTAIEQVEERGDYSTRRAFALTLDGKRSDRKMRVWSRRVRRADDELEPTAAWLEAA